MSTILDSLKKSSDQRDNNNQTSIDNFNFGEKKSKPIKGVFVFLLIALITAALMYFGYNYLFKEELANSSDAVENIELVDADENAAKNAASTDIKRGQNTQETKQVNKIQKPDINKVRQELQNTQKKLQANKTEKDVKQPQNLADLNKHTRSTTHNEKTTKQPQQINNTAEVKPEVKPELTLKTKQERQAEEKQVVQQKYPYVYQLPFSVRKEIPKFTLNVHIFDEKPENRVVVINGAKFVINDLIEEEVLVKDIVIEGAVLEFNETEFLVPKL